MKKPTLGHNATCAVLARIFTNDWEIVRRMGAKYEGGDTFPKSLPEAYKLYEFVRGMGYEADPPYERHPEWWDYQSQLRPTLYTFASCNPHDEDIEKVIKKITELSS